MAYTTIIKLPELLQSDIIGNEYLLTSTDKNTYKLSLTTINDYIIKNSSQASDVLKNKIIDDITNYVHANAIHYSAKADSEILKGTPVKLVQNDDEFIHVDVASGENDICIGVAEADILKGELGLIMISGTLDSFDTSAWAEGTMLYAKNGKLTHIQPTSGMVQFIGYVLTSSLVGKILINGQDPKPDASSLNFDNTGTNLSSTNVQDAIAEVAKYAQNKEIIRTERLLILDDEAELPLKSEGVIVEAYIYQNLTDNVITEYTCTLNTERNKLLFDFEDNLNGKYAQVSYLTVI